MVLRTIEANNTIVVVRLLPKLFYFIQLFLCIFIQPYIVQITCRKSTPNDIENSNEYLTNAMLFAGTPPMTGTAMVLLTVVDANDNAPSIIFDPAWPLVVKATTQSGDKVVCFNASNPDTSHNPSYFFNYVCNSGPCKDFNLVTVGKLTWTLNLYTYLIQMFLY